MSYAQIALIASLACLVAAAPAAAGDTVGEITINEPWARATVGAGAGAAFLGIDNAGAAPDRLVGASSPVSKVTELHTHIRDGEVMRMREVDAIDIPAKATTTLQPGGLHIMLTQLAEPLAAGGSFPLTLRFAGAGEVTVTVQVKDVAAMGHGATGGHGAMGEKDKPAETGY
ncbi:MAG: copper chaperone PCu(A)C [Rhodospirillales bacterium]|jgi:copper(I)-binding protein|nr:copper chaperone PCu(A)C [Rhodospirillales bacterium]